MPAVTSGRNERSRFRCTDDPTVLILCVEHTLTFSLLCTHVQLGRGPLIYGKDPSFTLSLFLSHHCAFQTQKSSLGSQSESDRPQKRAFTSTLVSLCGCFIHSCFDIPVFLFVFCSFHGDLEQRATFVVVHVVVAEAACLQLGSTWVCLIFC
ncbi:hypothetical protein VNO77_32109 [Canavalia gladiata]|uniref:Transmembrane protein n=1 Tax=Canavalia gladiata TaxID=3824 RepID=A0AAN9Q498_CANGL